MRASATQPSYQRRRQGEPSAIRIVDDLAYIEVRRDGTCAVIDAIDLPLAEGYLWHYFKDAVYRVTTPRASLHRVILGRQRGDGTRIDHRDGDVLNNRRLNLRVATAAQNGWNQTKRWGHNTSGLTGVSRKRGKWRAYINVNGARIELGTFPTVDAAAAARRAAELEHFGEWAPHGITSQKSPVLGVAGAVAPMV